MWDQLSLCFLQQAKELQMLNNLRKLFIDDIGARIKNVRIKSSFTFSEEQSFDSSHNRWCHFLLWMLSLLQVYNKLIYHFPAYLHSNLIKFKEYHCDIAFPLMLTYLICLSPFCVRACVCVSVCPVIKSDVLLSWSEFREWQRWGWWQFGSETEDRLLRK